jgi:hypothetical protein
LARKLIFQNVIQQIAKLAEEPSEPFVRMLLQNAGLSHVRTKALSELREITRSAFREFVNLRILQRLDIPAKDKELEKSIAPQEPAAVDAVAKADDVMTPSPLELEVKLLAGIFAKCVTESETPVKRQPAVAKTA